MRSLALGVLLSAASVFGQAPEAPAFEVASIKQSTFPGEGYFRGFSYVGICVARLPQISGGRVTFTRTTLCGLIMVAYGIPTGQSFRIVGMPKWMAQTDQSLYYDIQARVEGNEPVSPDRVRQMLQTLLADRFQLVLHPGKKEAGVYALLVSKNGHRLSSEAICEKPGEIRKPKAIGMVFCKPTESMVQFAADIGVGLDRPVVDMTGLTGKYAFSLVWMPDPADGPKCSPAEPDCIVEPARPGPELLSALQHQAGLTLERRTIETDVLVIDRALRPTPN
jgi:uncharacterized protein (TIGR03435 family)